MVRDLAERGVLEGSRGAYALRGDAGNIDVPATLQATIGARIDRLSAAAKHTLGAAAVIGSRFDARLLEDVVETVDVTPLIAAELVDQVKFGRRDEYAFRHPLIRAVAYKTQLKSDRAELHRRLATIIEATRSSVGRRECGTDRRASGDGGGQAWCFPLAFTSGDVARQPRLCGSAYKLATGAADRRQVAG